MHLRWLRRRPYFVGRPFKASERSATKSLPFGKHRCQQVPKCITCFVHAVVFQLAHCLSNVAKVQWPSKEFADARLQVERRMFHNSTSWSRDFCWMQQQVAQQCVVCTATLVNSNFVSSHLNGVDRSARRSMYHFGAGKVFGTPWCT